MRLLLTLKLVGGLGLHASDELESQRMWKGTQGTTLHNNSGQRETQMDQFRIIGVSAMLENGTILIKHNYPWIGT